MIFEILVDRNTPSTGDIFSDFLLLISVPKYGPTIFGPLRQIGYVPRPCPNRAQKFGIFNFSPKVVTLVLNRKLLVS